MSIVFSLSNHNCDGKSKNSKDAAGKDKFSGSLGGGRQLRSDKCYLGYLRSAGLEDPINSPLMHDLFHRRGSIVSHNDVGYG